MKLPPRRILRAIVSDAIDDRVEFDDESVADRTAESIAKFRDILPRLADAAPPLAPSDIDILASACVYARIWREGYLEAWEGTGDKPVILEARQDVDRVTRVEQAIGMERHWLSGGPEPEGMRSVNVMELLKRPAPAGWSQNGISIEAL